MKVAAAVAGAMITAAVGCSSGGSAKPQEQAAFPTEVAAPGGAPAAELPMVRVASPRPSGKPCRRSQLAARFGAGGFATGNVFGGVEVRNLGPRKCVLSGVLHFIASETDGAIDPNTSIVRKHHRVRVVLPTTTRWRLERPNFASFDLQGAYRDDPHGWRGLCAKHNEVTPVSVTVTVGRLRFSVRNLDSRGASGYGVSQIYGCHGLIMLGSVARPEA